MKGFTLIETLVVIGIMGILVIANYPAMVNSMENRQLDNAAMEVTGFMQSARFKAIDTKVNHRVRFAEENGVWVVRLEKEASSGTWTDVHGMIPKTIPAKFVVTLNLPADQSVEFSSVGLIESYDSTRNSLTIQSPNLRAKGKYDLRRIQVFAGGSIRYLRTTS